MCPSINRLRFKGRCPYSKDSNMFGHLGYLLRAEAALGPGGEVWRGGGESVWRGGGGGRMGGVGGRVLYSKLDIIYEFDLVSSFKMKHQLIK